MDNQSPDFWLKQPLNKPLFPDLQWSRPENKQHAGKLLIIGGSASGFKAPAEGYNYAVKAGIGTARILLPDSLRKAVGRVFLEIGEYAASTPSGSFSYKSFAELLTQANWADGVLLAGDFGHNSETTQLLEYFISKYSGQLTLVGDAIDCFLSSPGQLLKRPNTLIVPSTSQLQKLAKASKAIRPFTSDLDLQNFATTLQDFASQANATFIATNNDQTFVAAEQKISSTPVLKTELELASSAAVWWLQSPNAAVLASLTTSIL